MTYSCHLFYCRMMTVQLLFTARTAEAAGAVKSNLFRKVEIKYEKRSANFYF